MKELRLHTGRSIFDGPESETRFDFPEDIVRVTAGRGGESLLIIGNEKTALLDCGMVYAAEDLIYNIHAVLEDLSERTGRERILDYILATHTHYDHIGAMGAVKEEWPQARICAGAYAAKVFSRPGAIAMIEHMSNVAAKQFTDHGDVTIDPDSMRVDQILHEGDTVSLGDKTIGVIETPGHTNCSLSYTLEPDHILFTSETTGVIHFENGRMMMESQILKSYEQGRIAVDKCRAYHPKRIIVPHYGIVPVSFHDKIWDYALNRMEEKYNFAKERYENMTDEEIIEAYVKAYWNPIRAEEQPYEAFYMNAQHEMLAALKELRS